MSRLMSVAMTTDAVVERRKTVTRRKGWWTDKNGRHIIKAGDTLTLCRKVQGRKPGEPIERLAEVEVVSVRREPLCVVGGPYVTDQNGATIWPEMIAEGFPDMSPSQFMLDFFIDAQGINALDDVTRIEWRYICGGGFCPIHGSLTIHCDIDVQPSELTLWPLWHADCEVGA